MISPRGGSISRSKSRMFTLASRMSGRVFTLTHLFNITNAIYLYTSHSSVIFFSDDIYCELSQPEKMTRFNRSKGFVFASPVVFFSASGNSTREKESFGLYRSASQKRNFMRRSKSVSPGCTDSRHIGHKTKKTGETQLDPMEGKQTTRIFRLAELSGSMNSFSFF